MNILVDDYDVDATTEEKIYKWSLTGLIIVFMCLQIYIDVKQGINGTFAEYFGSFFNIIDLMIYVGTSWILTVQILETDFPNLAN